MVVIYLIRILQVVKKMDRNGAETFLMNIYRNINRDKYKFIFLCKDGVEGAYDKEIIELGGEIVHIDFNPTNIIKFIRDIKSIIKEKNIDVIHSHIGYLSGLFCFVAYKCNVIVRISHSHTSGTMIKQGFTRKLYIRIMKYLTKKYSTHKLACGDKAGKYMYEDNFIIINNGIDLNNFKVKNNTKLKRELGINDCKLIIGHVGRFLPVKNHDFFIKIAKEIKKRKIDFKIVLVGDGPGIYDFKEKIKEQNISDSFIFTGVREDVPNIMQTFDVFVMPSIYEGFPVTVIEALAAGLPCVLSDTITKEVSIIENECLFISLNEKVTVWVDKIIEQSKLSFDIEKNKRILDDKNYSAKSVAKELTDIYKRSKKND